MSNVPKGLKKLSFDDTLRWVRKTLALLDHLDTIDRKRVITMVRSILTAARGGDSTKRLLEFRAFHTFIKESSLIQEFYQRYQKTYGTKAKSLLGWLRITENKKVLKLLKDHGIDDLSLYLGSAAKLVDLTRLARHSPVELNAIENLYTWLSKHHHKPGTQLTQLLLSKFSSSEKVLKPFEAGSIIDLLARSKDKVPRALMNFIKGSLGEALTLPHRVENARQYLDNGAKLIANGPIIHFDEILVIPHVRGKFVDVDGQLKVAKETTDGIVIGKVAGKNTYQVIEIHEVKTTIDSTFDALEQFNRRQENLGELGENAEGILALVADGDYYKWEKGRDKAKVVKHSKKNPLEFDLNKGGKPDTIGYHQAKMKVFVPSDHIHRALQSTNTRFELESIGLPWESLEKLAALLTSNLIK